MPIPTPPNRILTARPIDAEAFYAERAAQRTEEQRNTYHSAETEFDNALLRGDFDTAEGIYETLLEVPEEDRSKNGYIQALARVSFRRTSMPLFERFLQETGVLPYASPKLDIETVHPNLMRQLQSLRDQRRSLESPLGRASSYPGVLFGFEAEIAVLALRTRQLETDHDTFTVRPATFAEDNAKREAGFRSGVDLFALHRTTGHVLKTQVKAYGTHQKNATKYLDSIDVVSLPALTHASQLEAEELKHALIREQHGRLGLRQQHLIQHATMGLDDIYEKRVEKLSA